MYDLDINFLTKNRTAIHKKLRSLPSEFTYSLEILTQPTRPPRGNDNSTETKNKQIISSENIKKKKKQQLAKKIEIKNDSKIMVLK